MDKKAVIEIIERFQRGMADRGVRPTKIILYGSHAKGTSRGGSDIDLVVISDDFKDMGFWERIDLLSEVIFEIFAPIEAIALTQDEWDSGESLVTDFARNGEIFSIA